MASLLGKVGESSYNPSMEEWSNYVERLVANDIVGDEAAKKRRAVFISVVAPGTYNILKNLLAPEKRTSFEQLKEKLTQHFSPQPSEVMQRFRFNSHVRKEGESAHEYVAELPSFAILELL